MLHALRSRLLPESQRRTAEELTSDLDLDEGDVRAKRSAYWTMLVLAAVIACAGVVADSTATVIGAMIIAPLSTPIMGTALSIVKRERTGGLRFVVLGALLVIAIGVVFGVLLPATYDLTQNGQVTGRTSPGVIDLVAALATGMAGAVALARRDVAAILPGVAISISLVPPLGVVGICLGNAETAMAFGALLLFLSNLLALVFAGTFVFTAVGYVRPVVPGVGRVRRARRFTVGVLVALVILPLVLNTAVSIGLANLDARAREAATAWLSGVPGSEVVGVEHQGLSLVIRVSAPGALPPTDLLLQDLSAMLFPGIPVTLERTVGERLDLGTVP